jgi:ADP-ribose pyrophosphatase YjhB (NUDIX family)
LLQIETSLRQPSARLGCGAAIVDRNRLLLIKRRKNPEAGYWGLPGGKVDPSEDIEAAVRREIAEELGIELALQRLLRLTQFVDAGSGDLWVAPVLLASVRSGMPQINEPQALAELAWFALDRLPTPLTAATIQAMEALDE